MLPRPRQSLLSLLLGELLQIPVLQKIPATIAVVARRSVVVSLHDTRSSSIDTLISRAAVALIIIAVRNLSHHLSSAPSVAFALLRPRCEVRRRFMTPPFCFFFCFFGLFSLFDAKKEKKVKKASGPWGVAKEMKVSRNV